MSEIFLAWLAGLFDGEGTVVIWQSKKHHEGRCHLRVAIANTDRAMLQDVKDVFGGSISTSSYKTDSTKNKDCYAIGWTGPSAVKVLEAIQPYIRERRKRRAVKVALHFQAMHYDWNRYESMPGRSGRKITKWARNEDLAHRSVIMKLNGYKKKEVTNVPCLSQL